MAYRPGFELGVSDAVLEPQGVVSSKERERAAFISIEICVHGRGGFEEERVVNKASNVRSQVLVLFVFSAASLNSDWSDNWLCWMKGHVPRQEVSVSQRTNDYKTMNATLFLDKAPIKKHPFDKIKRHLKAL